MSKDTDVKGIVAASAAFLFWCVATGLKVWASLHFIIRTMSKWTFAAAMLHLACWLLATCILCGGEPSSSTVPRAKPGEIIVCPDNQARTFRYVAEHLTLPVINGPAVGRSHFIGDHTVPYAWRAEPSDYVNKFYDMGHGAANGNYGDQATRDSTMVCTNCCPQAAQLNRDWWRSLEQYNRNMVDKTHEVDIVTMPGYLPDADGNVDVSTIGKHNVWVPTHCIKAVMVSRDGEPLSMWGWVVPNNYVDPDADVIRSYRETIDMIEVTKGLELFSWVEEAKQKRLEAATP